MKKQYSFKGGWRGAVPGVPPGKTRITIRVDNDIMNQDSEELEDTLCRVVREELNSRAG